MESYNEPRLHAALRELGLPAPRPFVQDNHSVSRAGVLRGLHYQLHRPQGKLVRVVAGSVFDVAVDLRRGSPGFGQWVGEVLSAENCRQMWIPEGFAHGFLVLSDAAELLYKATDYWSPGNERCIAWNDPQLAIDWPLTIPPVLSAKDQDAAPFATAELYD
jgi:dTDP-4-dehydrorhamnose 3,5-epimerase